MTLLGFEIVLEDQVKNVAEGVGLAEDFIKDAVKRILRAGGLDEDELLKDIDAPCKVYIPPHHFASRSY